MAAKAVTAKILATTEAVFYPKLLLEDDFALILAADAPAPRLGYRLARENAHRQGLAAGAPVLVRRGPYDRDRHRDRRRDRRPRQEGGSVRTALVRPHRRRSPRCPV